jgi:hypothetical protein
MISEIEKIRDELIDGRKKLMQDVEALREEGKESEAVEKVKEATRIADELKGLEEAKRLEEEISELEKKEGALDTKIEEKKGELLYQQKVSEELEAERERILEGLESLVESGRGEEAVENVKAAGKITEEINRRKEEVLGRLKEEENNLEEERSALEREIGRLSEEQKGRKMKLEAIRGLEKPEPIVEEEEKTVEEPAEVSEEVRPAGIEPEMEVEPSEEKEGLSKVDHAILKGISMGYKSPKKLSKAINIDKNVIKDRMEELTKMGYLK